jgi:hypothetical protein
VSDRVQLLVFAVTFALGFFLALWLAASAPRPTRSQIFERFTIFVLYMGSIGAMLVAGFAVAGRSIPFALAPIIAGFFMDGVILAMVAPLLFAGLFKGRHRLQGVVFSAGVVRASRYLTASYFLMAGLFKWITDAEYPFFQASGYGRPFYVFICAFECVCAVGLLFRALVLPVVLILFAEMLGAAYTHFHNYFVNGFADPFGNSLDAFRMLILLAYIGVVAWRKIPFRQDRAAAKAAVLGVADRQH